jgi:hypothetical protein
MGFDILVVSVRAFDRLKGLIFRLVDSSIIGFIQSANTSYLINGIVVKAMANA